MYITNVFFSQQQGLSSRVFAHLCDVVDDDKQYYDDKIHQISKLIILEGKILTTTNAIIMCNNIYLTFLHPFNLTLQ